MWHKINYVWGALASLFVVATAIFKDRLLGDKGSNAFWFLLGGTVAWWIFAAVNAPRLSKEEKERRAAELERLAVEKARIEEEKKRREEERRREEEERRREEEEKKDAVDSVLFRLCLLSPRALLLLAAINKTRERLEVFDDSPSVRCGRLTFSHVEVDDLRRAGYLEKVEDDRGGARVVYRLTDQGAAAFLVGRSKGLFDGLEV